MGGLVALKEAPIRSRDITTTPTKTRVVRRWSALSTDVTKGAGGWQLTGMPDIGTKLGIASMGWGVNEEPVCVVRQVIPRGSLKRSLAFAIYEMSKMA